MRFKGGSMMSYSYPWCAAIGRQPPSNASGSRHFPIGSASLSAAHDVCSSALATQCVWPGPKRMARHGAMRSTRSSSYARARTGMSIVERNDTDDLVDEDLFFPDAALDDDIAAQPGAPAPPTDIKDQK